MQTLMRMLALALLLAFAVPAQAELFKCKNAEGKTVYSDQRCPNSADDAKPKAEALSKPAAGSLSPDQRQRVENLEVTTRSPGANNDQKWAARLEINAIRSGLESRLTQDERAKRDGLVTDLGSADGKKRQEALKELRWFYNR